MGTDVTNVVFAGLGGQGVLKASDILTDAVFRAGYEVKKSEIHGMSQRGGSVASDVRFGRTEVLSPMVPPGEADFVVVLAPDQVELSRSFLSEDGALLTPDLVEGIPGANTRTLNIAMLGALSTRLEIDEIHWQEAIHANLPEKYHQLNDRAFAAGRNTGTGYSFPRLADERF